MKRTIALLLVLICIISCFGCAAEQPEATETQATTEAAFSQAAVEKLHGKKIIFVGNSYTYFAHTVLRASGSGLTQDKRGNDEGYFYQLCKTQGAEVSVTNWTFGDHALWESLGHSCTREACFGVDHLSYLTDRYFDYVVLQPYSSDFSSDDVTEYLQPMMDVFREANPNVQFILAVPHMTYHRSYAWKNKLPDIDRSQITVCNWGKMLADILNGTTQVPNGTQQYFNGTFIVSVSEKDGHHQNLLVGYLTALMVYCAITGDSAVGLPYDFCSDTSIRPEFDMEAYKKEKYVLEPFTNFIDVFNSPADMEGLQILVDRYIAEPFGTN